MELLLDKEHLKYYNQDLFAKAAISVLYDTISNSETNEFEKIIRTKEELIKQNQHNIVVKNALDYFMYMLPKPGIKESAKEKYNSLLARISEANKDMADIGAKKIKNKGTVFVHSINNQILDMLVAASKYKEFTVNILQHSPFSFGNHLSAGLKKNKIDAAVFPDIAIEQAARSADACFIGGEAITKDGNAVAKTGSSVALDISKKYNIPTYVCLHSLKYDHKKTMHEALNHQYAEQAGHDMRSVYETISKEEIGAYICEYGVFKPENVVEEIKFYNSWMFI